MANIDSGTSGNLSDQAIQQINYADYVGSGGNPATAQLGPNNQVVPGATPPPSGGSGDPYGIYASTNKYAPYDVGGGKTRWDEFVRQMQLEQNKLDQAKQLQQAQLAQQKALEEERLAQQQKIADQNTVEAFGKDLMGQKGPADPYGYLFSSRGLAAPQGYSPTPLPLAAPVAQSYKDQGIDLSDAQKQISGSSGPSFIQGYLGSMSPVGQQGPMGFQNSAQFKDLAPGSDASQQAQQGLNQTPGAPNPGTPPIHAAQGLTVPGYAPGQDTVPAMLSPGEGVLKPQAVQAIGGPQAINAINSSVQKFAQGGVAQPIWQQPLTDMGNGQFQRGTETGTVRATGTPTQSFDSSNMGAPIRSNPNLGWGGQEAAFGSHLQITGPMIQGANNFNPNNPQGSTGWYPIRNADGTTGYMSAYDLAANGFTMPQTGNKQSLNPDLPQGYQLQSAGVAQRTGSSGVPNLYTSSPSFGQGATQVGVDPMQGGPAGVHPIGWSGGSVGIDSMPGGPVGVHPLPGQSLPGSSPIGQPSDPNATMLTGGVLNPSPPAGGSPINLNMLDPYTRSLVNQYGVPQTPSAQALANMPQSGADAYKNYVEKVAGGNYQDLLDQSKTMNPSGANPDSFTFS